MRVPENFFLSENPEASKNVGRIDDILKIAGYDLANYSPYIGALRGLTAALLLNDEKTASEELKLLALHYRAYPDDSPAEENKRNRAEIRIEARRRQREMDNPFKETPQKIEEAGDDLVSEKRVIGEAESMELAKKDKAKIIGALRQMGYASAFLDAGN